MEQLVLRGWVDRDEAIRAGRSQYGEIEVRVEDVVIEALSDEERAWLARSRAGNVLESLKRRSWDSDAHGVLPVPPVRGEGWVLDALRAAYQRYVETEAAYQVKVEEAADVICALSTEELAAKGHVTAFDLADTETAKLAIKSERGRAHLERAHGRVKLELAQRDVEKLRREVEKLLAMPLSELADMHPGNISADAREVEAVKVRRAIALREQEEQKLAEEARRAKQAELDKAEFDRYVQDHGTESQRIRHAAGLLPVKEIVERRRSEVFPDLQEYKKLREADIECDEDCRGIEPKFSSSVYKLALSEQVFDEFQQIKDEILRVSPNAEVELRCHECWCSDDNCGGPVVCRFSVRASVRWAGHELARLFEIDATDVEIEELREARRRDCSYTGLVLKK